MKRAIVLILMLVILSGCFKNEEKLNEITGQIESTNRSIKILENEIVPDVMQMDLEGDVANRLDMLNKMKSMYCQHRSKSTPSTGEKLRHYSVVFLTSPALCFSFNR